MKIQTMAIIYTLIIIPIFIVLSFSLATYAKLVNVRADYDMKILGATQDAIKAFELNTGDEEFSKVPDLLSSIVEASFNVFRDSLATKMGMSNASKPLIDQYFPLGIFSLYDGMYISTPSNEREVLRDLKTGQALHVDSPGVNSTIGSNGNTEITGYTPSEEENVPNGQKPLKPLVKPSVKPVIFKRNGNNNTESYTTNYNDPNIKTKQKHILKTYIPYAAKFNIPNGYITVNYSLDNYVAISGKKGNITFSKSGYLLNLNRDIGVEIESAPSYFNGLLKGNSVTYGNDEVIDRYFDKLKANQEEITLKVRGEQIPIYNYNEKEYSKFPTNNNGEITINIKKSDYNSTDPNSKKFIEHQISAIKYYMKAKLFTDWVKANFMNLTVNDITLDVPNVGDLYKNDGGIFEELKKNNPRQRIFEGDPLDPNSEFHAVRKAVIKSQIEYHILLATVNYNKQKYTYTTDYKMPYIRPTDWDKILNNISFTIFAEGFINNDFAYSNYFTASSTNNDFNINPKSLVYVRSNELNNQESKYYAISANHIKNTTNYNDYRKYMGIKRMKFDYDAVFDKKTHNYIYDHKNIADISTIFTESEAKLNQTQVYLTQVGLASQKEQQYKFSKVAKDSTLIYQDNGGTSIPSGLNGENDTIKSITITFGFNSTNNNQSGQFNYFNQTKDVIITFNEKKYMFPMRINKGNSKDVKKIYNGLELVSNGRVAPDSNFFNNNANFSIDLLPQGIVIKQIKFEKY